MADWMEINSESIYGTRPWKQFGEGPTNTVGGHTSETVLAYTKEDFRFTTKGDSIYIFAMTIPKGDLLVKSLPTKVRKVTSVELVGSKQTIQWKQSDEGLQIEYAEDYPSDYIACFRVR